MHEVCIVSDMLKIVDENVKANNMKTIDKIVIDIGEFTCVEESSLRFSFDTMKIGTICEDTKLIINKVKATAKCNNCGDIFNITYTNKLCPKCNDFSGNIITGYELLIQSIEGDLYEDRNY